MHCEILSVMCPLSLMLGNLHLYLLPWSSHMNSTGQHLYSNRLKICISILELSLELWIYFSNCLHLDVTSELEYFCDSAPNIPPTTNCSTFHFPSIDGLHDWSCSEQTSWCSFGPFFLTHPFSKLPGKSHDSSTDIYAKSHHFSSAPPLLSLSKPPFSKAWFLTVTRLLPLHLPSLNTEAERTT